MKRGGLIRAFWLVGFLFIAQTDARPPALVTNVWTRTDGGNWDEPTAWSLGRLPAINQWVGITNAGAKTIEINAQTAQTFPQSLSISHLLVANTNTLFLNHVGATLRIDSGGTTLNGLEVARGSKLLDSGSDLNINGWFHLIGSEFVQDGGTVEATPWIDIDGGAVYRLTNGIFKAGYFEMAASASFHQYAGTVSSTNSFIVQDYSNYYLQGGDVTLPIGLSVRESSTFTQEGGAIHATGLSVAGTGGWAAYLMDGGECYLDNLSVSAGMSEGSFEQNGGIVSIADTLELYGNARYYAPQPILGSYALGANGTLRAGSLVMNDSIGFCAFETSGQATISGDVRVIGSPDYPADFLIFGGMFSCQNFFDDDAVVDISQTGGALVISGALSFTGYYPGVYNGINARPARYDFKGGTLTANRIDMAAEWVIGSSTQPHRINNPGQFTLAGTLRVGDAVEQLGRFILSNNATINLGDGRANLAFAASGGEQWNDSAMLVVVNWEGSPSGGGLDQLKFGNDGSGLSVRQLRQIVFINPAGLQPGQYLATILSNGEIVPAVTPQLSIATAPNSLVINWSDDRVLQSSPNVDGPYTDLPTASSPYTVDITSAAQLFLRLRP